MSRVAHYLLYYCSVLCTLCLACPLWAAPDPNDAVESAYQSARGCYYALINTPAQQTQRDGWEECIRQFLHVESKFPRSRRAADALFSAGKTYEQLFQASKNREDLGQAIRTYQAIAKRYDHNRLADDALYRAGVVYWNGYRDKQRATDMMRKLLRWHEQGDMAGAAKTFLTQLETQRTAQPIDALLAITPIPVAIADRRPAAAPLPAPAPPAAAPTVKAAPAPSCRIAIDPGHGGKDPGTVGHRGSLEKAVTLSIARRVMRHLTTLGCQVTLTRQRDHFVSLDDRNIIANRQKSDLFISIHANAAVDTTQHGVQTYYLNNASDQAAQRLASRENTMAGKSLSEVDHIVNTMLQNAFTDESRRLATAVHGALVHNLQGKFDGIQDQKVRSALFYVLVGAKSPSILVETSYLSNPQEEQRLLSPAYQETIAAGITAGVTQFLHTRPRDLTL